MSRHITFASDDEDIDANVSVEGSHGDSVKHDEDIEDEDAPPDDVSFVGGKRIAMLDAEIKIEATRNLRKLAKEKRRKHEQFLIDQRLKKKRRLEELAGYKLAEEVLVEVSRKDFIESSPPLKIEKTKRRELKNKVKRGSRSLIAMADNIHDRTEDFIPLNSKLTEFHVQVMPTNGENLGGVIGHADSLLLLKNKLICGNIKSRESTIKALAKKEKQVTAGLDVLPVINHQK